MNDYVICVNKATGLIFSSEILHEMDIKSYFYKIIVLLLVYCIKLVSLQLYNHECRADQSQLCFDIRDNFYRRNKVMFVLHYQSSL